MADKIHVFKVVCNGNKDDALRLINNCVYLSHEVIDEEVV